MRDARLRDTGSEPDRTLYCELKMLVTEFQACSRHAEVY